MALTFKATGNIKKAVVLINQIDTGKFPLLLSRILQKLHLKDERAFSDEEESKLQKAFSLSAPDLDLVIESCEFFLHQAAYHIAKPAVLREQLTGLDLEEEKVEAIVDTWQNGAKEVIDKLRHHTLAPKQLEDVNWRLHLQMSSAHQAKMKKPVALFELGIRDDKTGVKEKVRMEFTHEELYAFYDKLETIQSQLDSLS